LRGCKKAQEYGYHPEIILAGRHLNDQSVRERIGLSRDEFASMMRVSVRTLQKWEKHRSNPSGPAAALLKIVVAAPDVGSVRCCGLLKTHGLLDAFLSAPTDENRKIYSITFVD